MALLENQGRVRAVLGPTNTGKTYLAIDRMLAHATGMIGFPLRLLARENYDRIVALKGRRTVALITGEEKIIPPRPRWFVCTVESMPLDRRVDFLAIDEIQLCADPERGHVFTDRLLHARGVEETMFMGADTVASVLRALVPEVRIETRPRFSTLSYAGAKKLTRLPRRSAIVAFSLNEVYVLAELVRRHRGGTAVVLGALSPRTRNAQVAMYQAGEVDYMVATDAIGMGLNMEIDHVVFAGMRKFDGEKARYLRPAEIGQIAGRAGRYQKDGTFGVTHEVLSLDEKLVDAIENHQYGTIDRLCWRNRSLEFGSARALIDSLGAPPPAPMLYRAREGEDFKALKGLCEDRDVAALATNPAAIRLLWEVCQVPDFRKVMPDIHVRLLRRVYLHLASSAARLPADWIGGHIAHLDNVNGDIDTLTQRIAHIRTWTYISHRAGWLDDGAHWQGLARAIEDRLSDALHARLLQRFVDRRASVMAKQRHGELLSFVTKSGEVIVEGVVAGRLSGLRFQRDESQSRAESRLLVAAARTTIDDDIARRVGKLCDADDAAFSLSRAGCICWGGVDIAALRPGDTPLRPRIVLPRNEYLGRNRQLAVVKRLESWLNSHVRRRLPALFNARDAGLGAAGRGIAFQLAERLGSVPRAEAKAQIAALDARDRKTLSRLGLRFGAHMVYLNSLLRPSAQRLRAILAAVHADVAAPRIGRAAVQPADGAPAAIWAYIGYRVLGDRAIRFDCAERLAAGARKRAKGGAFTADAGLIALAGCDEAALPGVLADLGYRKTEAEGKTVFIAKRPSRRPKHRRGRNGARVSESPFAKLRDVAI